MEDQLNDQDHTEEPGAVAGADDHEGTAGEHDAPGASDQQALARLREALIASEPLVAPELVRAGSVTELEESFAAAKAAAQRARDLTLTASAPRISSGAPGRTITAPATAFEKIRAGLQSRG